MRGTSTRLGAASAALLLTVAIAAGCGGNGNESNSGGGDAAAPATDARGAPNGYSGNASQGSEGAVPQPKSGGTSAEQPSLARAIIRTGAMTIETSDVMKTRNAVATIADGNRVQISSEHTSADDEGTIDHAELVVRVPTAAYDETVRALQARDLGKVKAIQQQSTDVTEQVVDVNSRITTQRAGLARIRALMLKANTIGEVMTVDSELTRREAELESLLAKQKQLAGQTELATITVTLVRPGEAPPPPPGPPQRGFLHGLSEGWDAFTTSTAVLLMVAGAVLPFLVTALVIVVPVGWLIRRSRRNHPGPAPAGLGQ